MKDRKKQRSKRAFLADFEGSWEQGCHPLNELKSKSRAMDGEVAWWRLRDEAGLINKVNYPLAPLPMSLLTKS